MAISTAKCLMLFPLNTWAVPIIKYVQSTVNKRRPLVLLREVAL
jgi:hypothetical protein